MANYRFYFLNSENHFVSVVENSDCENDAAAQQHAVKLVSEQSKYPCVEIWDGARMVSRHHR